MFITFERLVRVRNLFGYVIRQRFAIYYRKQHFDRIESEGDIEFESIELCNISKTNSPILKLFSPADSATMVSG